MISFISLSDDKGTLYFKSTENTIATVIVIDGYTGLYSFMDTMEITKDVHYFFSHPTRVYHNRFEIWENGKLVLRIDVVEPSYANIEAFDIFKRMKNYKYVNRGDKDSAFSVYEIFVKNIYNRGNCQIKGGDIVFDVGGNLGMFSYYALCKGASEIYCFEPSPVPCQAIRYNFGFPNIHVVEAAVSAVDGEVDFYNNPNNSINSTIYEFEGMGRSEIISCKSVKLSTYLKENNIDRIDFLKLDCEGAEYEIVEDLSEDFLKSGVKKIVVEFHQNVGRKVKPMIQKLERCGFTIEFEHRPEQIDEELGIFYAYKL